MISPSLLDLQLIISTILLILLGVAHEWAGIQAYVKGGNLNVFLRNSSWIPETSKEKTLLGVFFMISFAWWQGQILLIALILIGNPLSYALGIIALIFNVPQYLLLRIYVRWNKVAKITITVHILSIVLWLTQFLIS